MAPGSEWSGQGLALAPFERYQMATGFSKAVTELFTRSEIPGTRLTSRTFWLALLRRQSSAALRVLESSAVSVPELEAALVGAAETEVATRPATFYGGAVASTCLVSDDLVALAEVAKGLADRLGSLSVDTHHFLWAFTKAPQTPIGGILAARLTPEVVERYASEFGDLDIEPEEVRRCERCQLASYVESAFRTDISGRTLCSQCREEPAGFPTDFLLMGLALVLLATHNLPRLGPHVWFGAFVCWGLYIALRYPTSLWHEIGHAVAGKLVGYDVVAIAVGEGKPMARFKFGRIPVLLSQTLSLSRTYIFPTTPAGYRWRYTIVLLSGSLFNFLAFGILFWGCKSPWDSRALLLEMRIDTVLLWANLVTGVWNLFPSGRLGGIQSDGLYLWNVWMNDIGVRDCKLEQRASWAYLTLSTLGFYEEAKAGLKGTLSSGLPDDETFSSAEELERALTDSTQSSHRPVLQGMLAWHRFFGGEFEASLALCQESLAIQPRNSLFLAVRAASWLGLGQESEALVQLRVVVRDPALVSRASVVCLTAWAERRVGDQERAAILAATAEKLNPGFGLSFSQQLDDLFGGVTLPRAR